MKLTKVFEGACKIANFRQLKLIVFVLAIMMSIGTFAQKEKVGESYKELLACQGLVKRRNYR